MSTTITVRTDEALRSALEEQAKARGQSLSDLVRGILTEAVVPRPPGSRIAHLRGALDLRRQEVEPWRRKIRDRNWRS